MSNDTLKLEDLEIYQLALEIGEDIWTIVGKWEYFAKKQLAGNFLKRQIQYRLILQRDMADFFIKTENNFIIIAGARY